MEKKSERLEVRLGYEEKQTFAEACENQGDTPSSAIRRFISGYVRRSDEDVLSTAWRGAAKRRAWRPIAFIAVFAAIAAAFIYTAKVKPFTSDDTIFSTRDKDGDGELRGHELAHNEVTQGFLRIMDLDNSGGISRQEFQSKGEMAYVLSGLKDSSESHKPIKDTYATLIKFHIQTERVQSGTYQMGGLIKGLDRAVFWHEGGGLSVLEGPVQVEIGEEFISP